MGTCLSMRTPHAGNVVIQENMQAATAGKAVKGATNPNATAPAKIECEDTPTAKRLTVPIYAIFDW